VKYTSILSQEKKDEIRAKIPFLIKELKAHRKKHKDKVSKRKIDLQDPAWVRVSPGPPNSGHRYRLCIGFKNVGCKWRENDPLGLGCLICGYYAKTAFKDVGSEKIVDQFKAGFRAGCEETTGFNSIEFLNDGSFLNPEEFDQNTQAKLFDLVLRIPRVKRVLVESRPEYVNEQGIGFLLSCLRSDQLLEIGIGLETVDYFVREICINKGFTTEDFEKALDIISSIDAQYPGRLAIVVYLLVKPAFLSHKECIIDIIASLKYLSSLNNKYPFGIVAKLEPAAIANGTVLSMLHKKQKSMFYYEPLNYWAVLEILAKAANEIGEGELKIRVGAREDMDDVVKSPAIYNEDGETFHPFDFVIYDSIQKFNQHQNYFRLFATINNVYPLHNDSLLSDKKSSLMQWLAANGIERSASAEFIEVNAKSIGEQTKKQESKYDIEEMETCYGVLDILEGLCPETHVIKTSIDEAVTKGDREGLEKRIAKCFEQVSPKTVVRVNIIEMKIVGGYAEVFFDVTNLLRAEKISLWSRFVVRKTEYTGAECYNSNS